LQLLSWPHPWLLDGGIDIGGSYRRDFAAQWKWL
jgi:hypothetical protein